MTKNEFVSELNNVWEQQDNPGPTKVLILEYLIWYFDTQVITPDGCLPSENIIPYLPSYLTRAFEMLRLSTEEKTTEFQEQLAKITSQRKTPSLIKASVSINKWWRVKFIGYLDEILLLVHKKYPLPVDKIITYFLAQDNIITQAFTELFVNKVYHNGLYSIIQEYPHNAFSGLFKDTKLACYHHPEENAVFITFSRDSGREAIAFIVPEHDSRGLDFELSFIRTNYINAQVMIDEVASNWPDSRVGQKNIFRMVPQTGRNPHHI